MDREFIVVSGDFMVICEDFIYIVICGDFIGL